MVRLILRIIKTLSFCLALGLVLSYVGLRIVNYATLQTKVDKVIREDSRNDGMTVTCRYKNLFDYRTLVVDYQAVRPPAGKLSVLRSFFQLSKEMSDKQFDRVVISYRGRERFSIDGETFIGLGERYGMAQPLEMVLHLAKNLRLRNGQRFLSGQKKHYAALLEAEVKSNKSIEQSSAVDDIFSGITTN